MPIHSLPGFADPFSSIVHLVGALAFAVLAFFLIARGRGRAGDIVALAIFAFSVVFLLSMSGVYHLLAAGGSGRMVLQRLDHAGIFLLIAGSFTPVHGILFTGFWRWGVLALIWALAIAGITLKVIFFDSIPEWLGLSFYLGLGWCGLLSGFLLARRFGFSFIKPLFYSGLAYSLGGVADFLHGPALLPGVIGPHELFHVAVITGIGLHWRFVYCCLDQAAALRKPSQPSLARL